MASKKTFTNNIQTNKKIHVVTQHLSYVHT